MLTVLVGLLALFALCTAVMLWYVNDNLARIVNELSWFGRYVEKALCTPALLPNSPGKAGSSIIDTAMATPTETLELQLTIVAQELMMRNRSAGEIHRDARIALGAPAKAASTPCDVPSIAVAQNRRALRSLRPS